MANSVKEQKVQEIEARPPLWDKTLEIFKDRNATRIAWREVFLELRSDFDQLKEKEKNDYGEYIFPQKMTLTNDILQKYVKEEFGCGKTVCLDTKTRWSSLLAMLERFLEIKLAILKALINITEQMMANVEFETVTTIVAGLKSVKIGLEKLYGRNATLLTAEGVFSIVIG
ncbi:uncharacterized protein TNCV_2365061 [Trichonephila clavipes]|nr:uncharacterized protein TNCV_2365061 [Trichonephila clavipes]